MHFLTRPWAFCMIAAASCVFAAIPAWAQDAAASGEDDEHTIEVTPYTGPPIFLDEPEPQPDATFVSKRVDSEKYPDGKIRYEREIALYSDNRLVPEGFYREFYPNGQKFAEGQYVKGRQDGEWTYWHENGTVARKVTYRDGLPDGVWDVIRADGTLSAKRSYKAGKRDGTWIIYDETGQQPLREEQYADGLADGVWKVWFPNGQLRTQMTFKQGNRHGPASEWDEKGGQRATITYIDGLVDGEATLWTPDGKKIVQHYDKGKLVSQEEE